MQHLLQMQCVYYYLWNESLCQLEECNLSHKCSFISPHWKFNLLLSYNWGCKILTQSWTFKDVLKKIGKFWTFILRNLDLRVWILENYRVTYNRKDLLILACYIKDVINSWYSWYFHVTNYHRVIHKYCLPLLFMQSLSLH